MKWLRFPAGFRPPLTAAALLLALAVSGCGGGGGGGGAASTPAPSGPSPTATGSNVQAVVVDTGPTGASHRVGNVLFTSVTVCVPGTTQCQTIDHVMVDTGSSGLRLLSSVLTSITLPTVTVSGKPLLNCVQFLDTTYMWGSVATGDLSMSGEKAANLPIQVVGDPTYPHIPAICSPGGAALDNVAALGAKGILGIGTSLQDCGSRCVSLTTNGSYYVSTGHGTFSDTTVSLTQQLQQPVSLFASDNNGVVISLPSVSDPGATTVNGALIFGIGTQTNNSPASATVLALNGSGYFTTAFAGQNLTKGFIDSGSNGFFFGVASSPPYPLCTTATGWYCPAVTTALQATNTGTNGAASQVNFSLSNAETLFSNGSLSAWSTLAGYLGAGNTTSFDWGLPFFYGRNVFTAMDGKSPSGTPGGVVGPYVAY